MENDVKKIDGQKSHEIKSLLDKKRLGYIIRQSILRKYDSLRQFSKHTGYSYERVKAWGSGRQIPVVYDFVVLARILKIPMENLLDASVVNKMEYLDREENDNISEDIKTAIFESPTICLSEIALLLPYLGNDIFCDLVCRVIDNSDNFYVFEKFERYISPLYYMPGGKYVIVELMNRCSPLVSRIDMDLSGEKIDDLNKLREEMTLSDVSCECYMKECKDYYFVQRYYQLTKKSYLVYKDEFNEYIKENAGK